MKSMDVSRRCSGLFFAVLAAAFVAGCAPGTVSVPGGLPANLDAYQTATAAVTPEASVAATDLPVPTATQAVYTVVSGDNLSSIAGRFGVSLADLQAANPGVVAEALAVGTVLKIPVGGEGGGGAPSSTPAAAEVGAARCTPSGGGQYCFAAVHNPFAETLENVTLQISLVDASGKAVANQPAFLPLDTLPAGGTLPGYAFFPGGVLEGHAVARLVTAMRLAPGDKRYLPAAVRNVLVSVDWDGRSAQVQGEVFLPEGAPKAAGQVWLAGVAYDRDGQVVGFRRWEGQGGLAPGSGQAFGFEVYSLGPVIDRVDVVVEAKP